MLFFIPVKELNNYLLIILQLVVSVACSFTFGYLAPYYLAQVSEVGPRLLSGLMVAFVVALADLYFVLKFFLETEGVIDADTIKMYDPSASKYKSSKIKQN